MKKYEYVFVRECDCVISFIFSIIADDKYTWGRRLFLVAIWEEAQIRVKDIFRDHAPLSVVEEKKFRNATKTLYLAMPQNYKTILVCTLCFCTKNHLVP